MFATVRGVAAAPPTTGLVASAARPDDGDYRWTSGLVWVPERCGVGYQLIPWCSNDDPASLTPGTTAVTYHKPVVARVAVTCTTLGGGVDTERVRRVAEATTPFLVARELWEGDAAAAEADFALPGGGTATNRYLASSSATTVGAAASTPEAALGELEAAALEASRGQRVMLHVPPTIMLRLSDHLTFVRPNWHTPLDNLVVCDGGYTGTGPANQAAGATVWAYASSIVQVRMTPIEIEDTPAETTDRAVNSQTVWASRVFAATFDPCVHLAVEITRE